MAEAEHILATGQGLGHLASPPQETPLSDLGRVPLEQLLVVLIGSDQRLRSRDWSARWRRRS